MSDGQMAGKKKVNAYQQQMTWSMWRIQKVAFVQMLQYAFVGGWRGSFLETT